MSPARLPEPRNGADQPLARGVVAPSSRRGTPGLRSGAVVHDPGPESGFVPRSGRPVAGSLVVMENTTAAQTTTTDPGPAVAPVATPRRPRFKLRRSPTDVMLSGLSAGIAEELDLDPALVRIAMAVLTVLTSGVAALVYIAGWILAPVEPARS